MERANYISEKFKTVFYKVTCWKAILLLGNSEKMNNYVRASDSKFHDHEAQNNFYQRSVLSLQSGTVFKIF